MTNEEFLVELEIVSNQFDWTLQPNTGMQVEPRASPRLYLQGCLKGSPSAVFDPLRAVCYARTGRSFEDRTWPAAARALGLSPAEAARLLAATQDRTWEDTEDGTRQPVAELVSIRQHMLDATGVILEKTAGV